MGKFGSSSCCSAGPSAGVSPCLCREVPALAWLRALTQLRPRAVASPLPCGRGKCPQRQSCLLRATSAALTGQTAGQAFLRSFASSLATRTAAGTTRALKRVSALLEARTLPPDRVQRNDLVPEEIQCILAKGSPPNKEPASKPGAGAQPQALAWVSVHHPERWLQGCLHLHKPASSFPVRLQRARLNSCFLCPRLRTEADTLWEDTCRRDDPCGNT